jgi:phosphate uptake regulator
MKRRVVKQANQAYTITLPIDWVRKNKIDKKLEIDVNENERTLVINSEGTVDGGKIKLDVRNLCSRNIHIHINALYAKGVDEIEITSDKDISGLIIKATSNLMGYALVKQEGYNYLIKDVGGVGYSDLDEIFKRVFQMVILFYESAFSDIFGKSEETLDTLKSRDQEVNKFCLYLQRAINKSSYPDAINGRTLFTYSFVLEQIGD